MRTSITSWMLFIALIGVPTPSSFAAKFPPAIESRTYDQEIEDVIASLQKGPWLRSQTMCSDYRLRTQLCIVDGKNVLKNFMISRHGVFFAAPKRLDIRRFATEDVVESQFLRVDDQFFQYFVYENQLRRLWPDSLEKDRRADELVFPYVWLPFLANAYPEEYLRWADGYEYIQGVEFEGQVYDVLHSRPDYDLARQNRDIQSSSEYWGLRPQIRYYINNKLQRIEAVERLAYRWDRLKPNEPSYLYRRYVSRISDWQKLDNSYLPKTIAGEEWKPRQELPFRRVTLSLDNISVRNREPSSEYHPLWPKGRVFVEAELRNFDYYRKLADNDRCRKENLCAGIQCAFATGDYTRGNDLLNRVKKHGDTLSPYDAIALSQAYCTSSDIALVAEGGKLLHAQLVRSKSGKGGATSTQDRDVVTGDLHMAVSNLVSFLGGVGAYGNTFEDEEAGLSYLEYVLMDLRSPGARKRIVAKLAVEYARLGYWEKAESVLATHGQELVRNERDHEYFEGASARVNYWRTRYQWWGAVIDLMRKDDRRKERS